MHSEWLLGGSGRLSGESDKASLTTLLPTPVWNEYRNNLDIRGTPLERPGQAAGKRLRQRLSRHPSVREEM